MRLNFILILCLSFIFCSVVPVSSYAAERTQALLAVEKLCWATNSKLAAISSAVKQAHGKGIPFDRVDQYLHHTDDQPGITFTKKHAWEIKQGGTILQIAYRRAETNEPNVYPVGKCSVLVRGKSFTELRADVEGNYGAGITLDATRGKTPEYYLTYSIGEHPTEISIPWIRKTLDIYFTGKAEDPVVLSVTDE